MVVPNMFYIHPYLGKIPILTIFFQMGWNHQLDVFSIEMSMHWFFNGLKMMIRNGPKWLSKSKLWWGWWWWWWWWWSLFLLIFVVVVLMYTSPMDILWYIYVYIYQHFVGFLIWQNVILVGSAIAVGWVLVCGVRFPVRGRKYIHSLKLT